MNRIDILSIVLIIAVGFLVYYSFKAMRLLKGREGWRYLTAGYFFYTIWVFLSYFEGEEIYKVAARFIVSFIIIIFIFVGVRKLQSDLKRVGLTFYNLMYARYLLAGMALFLVCLGIRMASCFIPALNTPDYWALTRLSLLLSIVMLVLSSRRITLGLKPKITDGINIKMEGMEWIREDIKVLALYGHITNLIIENTLSIAGDVNISMKALSMCAREHDILRACTITREGLNIEPILGYLDNINEKEGLVRLYNAFSCFNSRLIDLYSAVTSPEMAVEIVRLTEEFIETLGKTGTPFDNELVYRYRILCGLPHGIAEAGKARTLIYMLFREIFEPLLMKCDATTLSGIKESDIAKDIDFSDGTINLDRLYRKIIDIPPGEARVIVASTFKIAMDSIYPFIKTDLGEEYVNKSLGALFSDMSKRHSNAIFKYDVLAAIPEDIVIPIKYKLFRCGRSYLIKEADPDRYFKVLIELDKLGLKAVLLTRTQPDQLREKYGLDLPIIWLTHLHGECRVNPTNITRLTVTISDCIKEDHDDIMFLDGFEYLVNQNGFDVALRFIESIKDHIALSRTRLLVPVDVRTLSETQLHRLQRELEPVEADVIRKAFV